MPTQRVKWFLIIGLAFGVLFCVFGCVNIANNYNKRYPTEKLPIRTLLIQIDKVQREELFTQLRKFSEKNNLDFYLSFYNSKETFFVEMYGETFEISGLSVPGTPEIIDIAFYEKDPSSPPTQETVDELFSDLKVFLGEIPSVTITEEK